MSESIIDMGTGLILPSNLRLAIVAPDLAADGTSLRKHNLPTEFYYLSTKHGDPSITSDKANAKVFKDRREVDVALRSLNIATGVTYTLWVFLMEFNEPSMAFDGILDTIRDL